MKIASDMFDHYIDKITSTWFGSHDLPADALCEYDALVLEIANDADQHNDLLPLRLAIDWILLNPEKYSLENHGSVYSFEHQEVADILRYVRQKIYPDACPPSMQETQDVTLYPQSRFEWWDQREHAGLLDRTRIVTNGPAPWVLDYHLATSEGRTPQLPTELGSD
jgi:hypothetical protein